MTTEKDRKYSTIKIKVGESFVYLKVIDEISFIVPEEQYQEYRIKIDNSKASKREVEVKTVGAANLKVEHVVKWPLVTPEEQNQEYAYGFLDNPNVHLETHKTKIYAYDMQKREKDKSTFIEVTRVDKIRFIVPEQQYQEYVYDLKWPDIGNEEFDYTDFGEIKDALDPVRTDPFQEIVDAGAGGKKMIIILSAIVGGSNPKPSEFLLAVNGGSKFSFDKLPTERTVESATVEPWWAPAVYCQFIFVNCNDLIGRELDIIEYFRGWGASGLDANKPIISGVSKVKSIADLNIKDGDEVSFDISMTGFGGMYAIRDEHSGRTAELLGGYEGSVDVILFNKSADIKIDWTSESVEFYGDVVSRYFARRWTWTVDGRPWPYDYNYPDDGTNAHNDIVLKWPKDSK